MTTFSDLVEETLSYLRGYTRDQEQATYLASGITDTATSATVADASRLSRGRVEIGDELLYVDSLDRGTNVLTIAPWGRGVDGSTAAVHVTNTKVTSDPIFPRVRVKEAINSAINSIDGDLFGVASATFTWSGAQWTYSLPSATRDVLSVTYEVPWGTPEWVRARRWTFNRFTDTTDFATGKSITIGDNITPGQTVRVTYTTDLAALSADADVFTTVTGLPESCRDVVVLGAAYRLLVTSEAFRLNTRAVEANQLDLRTTPGQPSQLSKFVYTLFRQRVDEERKKLLDLYPVRVHYNAR